MRIFLIAILVLLFISCNPIYCPEPLPREIILSSQTDIKDAYVNSFYNNSSSPEDERFTIAAGTVLGNPFVVRAFMQFNLSSIPSSHIQKIDSAILYLYANTTTQVIAGVPIGHNQLSGSNAWSIRPVISPWEENTVTWNTQPQTDNTDLLSFPATISISQDYEIDITHFIRKQLQNPSLYYGIMLKLDIEIPHRAVSFCSSENITTPYLRPKLRITFAKKQ